MIRDTSIYLSFLSFSFFFFFNFIPIAILAIFHPNPHRIEKFGKFL